MKQKFGPKHFSYCPMTYVLPHELPELQEEMSKNPNKNYIFKPSSSA